MPVQVIPHGFASRCPGLHTGHGSRAGVTRLVTNRPGADRPFKRHAPRSGAGTSGGPNSSMTFSQQVGQMPWEKKASLCSVM